MTVAAVLAGCGGGDTTTVIQQGGQGGETTTEATTNCPPVRDIGPTGADPADAVNVEVVGTDCGTARGVARNLYAVLIPEKPQPGETVTVNGFECAENTRAIKNGETPHVHCERGEERIDFDLGSVTAPQPASEACPSTGAEPNVGDLTVENMTCDEAKSVIAQFPPISAHFTAAGFSCDQQSGAEFGGTWRCTSAEKAFQFGFGD